MSASPFPIRPTAVHLKNFRGWLGEHELKLAPGLTLLVGENASGKSSALNAVEWCLFGGQVARKGSGIDERGDWEIRHRGAADDEVRVVLALEVEGGTARLARSRAADAKVRDPDQVRLELPGGDVLEGQEVAGWLSWNRLPDWTGWKRAFCQHQEQLRTRVTDAGDRSLQLGRLLGLEAYQEFSESLRSLKTKELEKAASRELERIEEGLEQALARPGAELRELEDQLEERGIARAEIGDATIDGRASALLDDAREVAGRIRLAAEVPGLGASDLDSVLRWTRSWERHLQARKRELEGELGELRGRWQQLDVALRGMEPSERRLADARAAAARWTKEHGDEAALDAQRVDLEKRRQALLKEEKGRNAALALLRQALDETRRRGLRDSCPVCEQESVGLDAAIARRIEEQGAADVGAEVAPLEARGTRLEEQLAELSRLRSEVRSAESEHHGLAEHLRSWIPEGQADPARAARDRLESWKRQIADLEGQISAVDGHLDRFRPEREVLGLFAKWKAARARGDAATAGLDRIAAWDELQQVIDEAAALACDLGTLGDLAREAQQRRSEERVELVNQSLGRHYGRVVGDPAGDGVRVVVKSTATRLTYRLVDATGADITPVLNQAALNALSFALLFAQAEDRAREGLPRWLVLDDPAQNLDEAGISGLVDAVLAVAGSAPVLLGTYPGRLSRELEQKAPGTARILRISDADDVRRIEEARP